MKSTSRLSLPAMPTAGQVPSTGRTPLCSKVTANRRLPSSASATTRAWDAEVAPEQYGIRPVSRHDPLSATAVTRCPGGRAAHTAHLSRLPGAGPPSSARIARASASPSANRTATRSRAANAEKACHRNAVRPEPGSGRSGGRDSFSAGVIRTSSCVPWPYRAPKSVQTPLGRRRAAPRVSAN